jgi:hypothetical protein
VPRAGITMQSAALPQPWRNLVLAVHIGATMSVLGMYLVLLALGVASFGGADPLTIHPAARLIAVVPQLGALAEAVTGPEPRLLAESERLPLVVGPAVASLPLICALILAIFKPGGRLRSTATAKTASSSYPA